MNNDPIRIDLPGNPPAPNFATTEDFKFLKQQNYAGEPLTLGSISSSFCVGLHRKRILIICDNRVPDRVKLLRSLAYAIDAMTIINQRSKNSISVEISYLECEKNNLFTGTDMAEHHLKTYLEKQEIDLLIILEDLGPNHTATTHMYTYLYKNTYFKRHTLKKVTIPRISINTNPAYLFPTDEVLALCKTELDGSLKKIQQLSAYLISYADAEGTTPGYFHQITSYIDDEYDEYQRAALNFVDKLPLQNKDITCQNAQNIVNIFYHEFCHAIDFLNLASDVCDLHLFNVDLWGGGNHVRYSHDLLYLGNITGQVERIYDEEKKKPEAERNKTIMLYDKAALGINARSQHKIQTDYYWEELTPAEFAFGPRPL